MMGQPGRVAVVLLLGLVCVEVAVGVVVVDCAKTEPGVQCVELVKQQYTMSWRVLEADGEVEVTLALKTTKTHPWMGIGVSPSGGMRGADIMAVHKSGDEWVVSDLFGHDYEPPVMDENQHVKLVSVEMQDSALVATLRRPIDACEFHDNAIVKGFAHPMIWAFGEGTDLTGWGAKHSDRGTVRMVLWEDPANPVPEPKDSGLFEIDLKMPDVEIAASPANTYMCTTFDLEKLSGKNFTDTEYHMVQVAPILDGAPGLVHHILLMTCLPGVPMYTEVNKVCPDMELLCPTMVVVWAVGGQSVTLPNDAGLEIGKHNGKQMWMQVHYYNPNGVSGKVDRSGLKLRLTSVLRQQHAAILSLAPNTKTWYPPIPAGQDGHKVRTRCDTCTQQYFDQDEVKVIAGMYHAHFLGKKITTHVIRNGVNIGPLYEVKRYDYGHQLYVQPRIPTLKRGDILETECEYDTLRKDMPTHFGDGSQEEMCISFILYYPRQPRLGWCTDQVWRTASEVVDEKPMYQPLCTQCRGNASWPEDFVKAEVKKRECDDPAKQVGRVATGDCPACAKTGACTMSDYMAFFKPEKNFCEYYCARARMNTRVPYLCIKGFADNNLAFSTAESFPKLEEFPVQPAGCTPKAAVRKVQDNCKAHTDCPIGKYCRNGRKVASEAEGLLWCTDCTVCCKRQDAVGPSGETDRLYRCPQSCGCEQSVQACARNGEVLCKGCCAQDKCEDHDEDGRKLLRKERKLDLTCSQLREQVQNGTRTEADLKDMCASVGVIFKACKMLGLSHCDGIAYLRNVCPVLCNNCPQCSLDGGSKGCSRCTTPVACSNTKLDYKDAQCTLSTCPWPAPFELTPTPAPSPSPASLALSNVALCVLFSFMALATLYL